MQAFFHDGSQAERTRMALDRFAEILMSAELNKAGRKLPRRSVTQIPDNKKGPTFR
jgi:hypothetical protein